MNIYGLLDALMPVTMAGLLVFGFLAYLAMLFQKKTLTHIFYFLWGAFGFMLICYFVLATAHCDLNVELPACQSTYNQRHAQAELTQAVATEQALTFTPTPTAAPYATAVRATAQAMRESALATLYPEGTPTP